MTQKTVVLLESNTSGNAVHIIEAAQALGYEAHYLTRDPELWRSARRDPIPHASRVSIVDTIDPVAMFEHVVDEPVSAVFWPDEIRLLPATLLGVACGILTPHQLRAFHTIRFKHLVRAACNHHSYEVPYALVDASAPGTGSPIGYPCVVKPVDESGSFGVRRCNDDDDYRQACGFIAANMVHISGYRKAGRIIVEKYLPGEEYSAEMVWHVEDGWRLIGFTRKLKGPEPFFVEIGHIFPHYFAPGLEKQIRQSLRKCLEATGLEKSVAHVEFKLVDEEVAIIEINPRLPGDMIVELVRQAKGIDLGTLTCLAHLGLPWTIPNDTGVDQFAAVAFICADQPGLVTGLASDHPDEVLWLKTVPRRVRTPESSADRLGCAIANAPDPASAWGLATQFASQVKVEIS